MTPYYSSGHLIINVGLLRSDTKLPLNSIFVEQYLLHLGLDVVEFKLFVSDTEPTAVAVLRDAGWTPGVTNPQQYSTIRRVRDEVAPFLKQDAIAVFSPGYDFGILVGPKSDNWGAFNPAFFLMPDGRRLAEHKNSTQN